MQSPPPRPERRAEASNESRARARVRAERLARVDRLAGHVRPHGWPAQREARRVGEVDFRDFLTLRVFGMVRGSALTGACSNFSDLDSRLESAFTADSTWLPPLSSGIQDEHQEWRPQKSGGVGGPRDTPARGIAHIPRLLRGHLHGEPSPASCHRCLATGELRAAHLSRAQKSS